MILNKKYVWCFMGQVHAQGRRSKMIDVLRSYGGENFCNVNSAWQSDDSIDTQEYKRILSESVFVPCPRGNNSNDTFRLYEALEVGSIPIVEQDDYWTNLLGEHPLLQTDDDWRKALIYIDSFLQNEPLLVAYSQKLQSWWHNKKQTLQQNIIDAIDSNTKTIDEPKRIARDYSIKQKQFLSIKDKWYDFVDYDFLKFSSDSLVDREDIAEKFSCYNAGKRIAVVSLYTPEIKSYALESEHNIREYCELQGYTFYVYREHLDKTSHPNWSKSRALLNHIDDHDYVIWMDSDTLIFDQNKNFEYIIDIAGEDKSILACEDIGSSNTNLPKGSLFNSGVVFFKNDARTKKILQKWWDFRNKGDTSSLYASGGDQEILVEIVRKHDHDSSFSKIFPMNQFNTDPRMLDNHTFILHFMAYPFHLKNMFMKYWNK